MPKLWVIAGSVFAAIAVALTAWRARQRRKDGTDFSTEPLSGQWLSEARQREEQWW